MIAKISRGRDMAGLLSYLTGPGRHNEHHSPRVIATGAGVDAPIGEVLSKDDRRHLYLQLDAPRRMAEAEVTGGHVWHLSLTNPADDKALTDEQWADAVRHTLAEAGLDGGADGQRTAPWVAVRHGASKGGHEHVHVAVSLVRHDLTKASTWQDRVKVSRACRHNEERFGLRVVEGRTAGAQVGKSRAELEIGERLGRDCDRATLDRRVRAAAAASADEAEFVRRLRRDGVRVAPRFAKADTGRVTGYSVSIRPVEGDTGEHRWFAGGKLARDLSLPALRAGWGDVDDQRAAWTGASTPGREIQTVDPRLLERAGAQLRQVTDRMGQVPAGDTAQWAAVARDAAGVTAQMAGQLGGADAREMARLTDVLAASARAVDQRTRHQPGLEGAAVVLSQVGLRAAKGRSSGWTVVAAEMVRLMAALAAAARTRQELQRARQLAANTRRAFPDGIEAAQAKPQLLAPAKPETAQEATDRLGGQDGTRPAVDDGLER